MGSLALAFTRSPATVNKQINLHNESISINGVCKLCSQVTNDCFSAKPIQVRRRSTESRVYEKGDVLPSNGVSDIKFRQMLSEALICSDINGAVVTAFCLKQNSRFQRLSLSKLATYCKIPKSELDTGFQEIKSRIDEIATELLCSSYPASQGVRAIVTYKGKRPKVFSVNSWLFDFSKGEWVARFESFTRLPTAQL